MTSLFMPKKDARTGKMIRGPTVPKRPLDETKHKARQLDRRALQLADEYEKQGHPIRIILHSNSVLTEADKGVVTKAIATIDDTLNAFNDAPAGTVKSMRDGAIARLEKTREALYIVLRGINWAHLPKTVLLVLFEMMAGENMVYELFGKRPQYGLALVCRAWHETVLECPAMWSRISIRNFELEAHSTKLSHFSPRLFKALEEVISRSKRHELRLSVTVPDLATDRTLGKKTTDPGQAYWAKKHIFLLVKQASRWARVKISCPPSLMACLCVLSAHVLKNLGQLSLGLKPLPGEVYTKVYTVQELSKALDPKRCIVILQGFDVLSRDENLITDDKRRFLTVQDGALLDPFNLPSLRAVTITSKVSPTKPSGLIADNTINSVSALLARSKCTAKLTMLTLTNAVFSETLLDVLHSLTILSELQVRVVGRGSKELKLVELRTMLKEGKKAVKHDKTAEMEQTLLNLVRLVFAIDVGQTHESGYQTFFGSAFCVMLKERGAKQLEVLQLSPSTRRLVAKKHWQEISGVEKISIRVQEPGV